MKFVQLRASEPRVTTSPGRMLIDAAWSLSTMRGLLSWRRGHTTPHACRNPVHRHLTRRRCFPDSQRAQLQGHSRLTLGLIDGICDGPFLQKQHEIICGDHELYRVGFRGLSSGFTISVCNLELPAP